MGKGNKQLSVLTLVMVQSYSSHRQSASRKRKLTCSKKAPLTHIRRKGQGLLKCYDQSKTTLLVNMNHESDFKSIDVLNYTLIFQST